jgi:hypothetical protein
MNRKVTVAKFGFELSVFGVDQRFGKTSMKTSKGSV